MLKALKIIKNIILGILGVIFFAFVLFMSILLLNYNDYGVTQINDKSLILVKEDLSTGEYKKGDLVIVNFKDIDAIKVGDKVFAYKVSRNTSVSIEYGKIVGIHKEENAVTFESGEDYAYKFIAGIPDKVYPNIGLYLSVIQSKWGFLFIILVPSFMIFIYEIYALIVEIKYGGEMESSHQEVKKDEEIDEDFKDVVKKKRKTKKVVKEDKE